MHVPYVHVYVDTVDMVDMYMYNLAIPTVTFQVVGLTAIQAPGTFSYPNAIEGQRESQSTAPTSRASLVL